jgi:hypothetical protein
VVPVASASDSEEEKPRRRYRRRRRADNPRNYSNEGYGGAAVTRTAATPAPKSEPANPVSEPAPAATSPDTPAVPTDDGGDKGKVTEGNRTVGKADTTAVPLSTPLV